jgi:16S rRNA (adenine1518-N6/adenine1519-N6)-dimethyltransferase
VDGLLIYPQLLISFNLSKHNRSDVKHIARKRFGQNFLIDQSIITRLIHSIAPDPEDRMLEIGPGLGALTLPLLQRLKQLIVVEIDRDLQQYWSSSSYVDSGQLQIIAADALTLDYSQFGSPLRIVGNLPYNISTPLLMHLLQFTSLIQDMYFMLQKEVVDRMVALPGCRAYGRLSVMLQYCCEVSHVLDVPATAFDPAPKVASAFVRLSPYRSSPFEIVDRDRLAQVLRRAFAMKRKTLNNNLKGFISKEQWQALGIDSSLRPEALSVADYVKLANLK